MPRRGAHAGLPAPRPEQLEPVDAAVADQALHQHPRAEPVLELGLARVLVGTRLHALPVGEEQR